jgi:HAD superfamily hydrolase (TIGR01549 family)
MIKAIIFDSDNTIFYSQELGLKILKKICEKNNLELDVEKYYSLTGMSRKDKIKKLFGDKPEIHENWMKTYEEEYKKNVIALPNAIETLKELKKRNLKLFIFSTKYSFLINQALEKFGVNDIFLEIIGGEAVPKKPSPEKINELLEKYGLKKEEVFLVGDSKVDEKAAQNIGIDLIQINYLDKKQLLGAKKEIFNLKELFELL